MAYPIEKTLKPFWAKGDGFIGGRDPLGIQNSSVAVYSVLLPGLNNVTDRLRYYGFYCWLLKVIEDKGISFKDQQEHYNYIRRAEYTLALYMSHYAVDEQGVAGSFFAQKALEPFDEGDTEIIDVKLGAEKYKGVTPKGNVYWDYSAGVLGQYYAGSLQDRYSGLGLIQIRMGCYFLTDVGRELGDAFGKSIDKLAADLFIEIAERGTMDMAEAEALNGFSLGDIDPNSDEGKYYMKMFFDADFALRSDVMEPTYFRSNTLKLLIEYLTGEEDASHGTFAEHIYQNNGYIGTPQENPSSVGWFYYFACELMHISLEHFLFAVLKLIEKKSLTVNEVVDELANQCYQGIDAGFDGITENMLLSNWIELLEEDVDYDYPNGINELQKSDVGSALAYALEYFLCTYTTVVKYKQQFEDFTKATETRHKTGTALDLAAYVQQHSTGTLMDFIKQVILKVINDHLSVAYSKMGSNDNQVHKLLIEDNYLVHINNIQPRFTGPRIRTAMNFLIDMKVIDSDEDGMYFRTEAGENFLSNLNVAQNG